MDGQAGVLLEAVVEPLRVKEEILDDGPSPAVGLNLLFSVEEDLAPNVEVPAAAPLGPISHQSAHSLGHICAAEGLGDELTESSFGAPCDEALLLQ